MAITTFYDHALELAKQENITAVEGITVLKKMGIDKLEIIDHWIEDDCDNLLNNLRETGIGVSALCAFFDFFQDKEAQIEQKLEYAQRIRAEKVLVIPGFYAQGDTDEQKLEKDKVMIDGVSTFAVKAKEKGITVMMEPFDSLISPIGSVEGLKKYIEKSGIYCAFDTGNFIMYGEDEYRAYDVFAGNIAHVHLKDRAENKPDEGGDSIETSSGKLFYPSPVGSGVIKIDQIITRLKKDGYNGDYAIEHFGTPNQLKYHEMSVKWIKARI